MNYYIYKYTEQNFNDEYWKEEDGHWWVFSPSSAPMDQRHWRHHGGNNRKFKPYTKDGIMVPITKQEAFMDIL